MSSQIALPRVEPAVRSPTRRLPGAGVPSSIQTPPPSRHWTALGLGNMARRVVAAFNLWRIRARSRAELAALDDRMLDDIGLTRIDVACEVNKPFWTE